MAENKKGVEMKTYKKVKKNKQDFTIDELRLIRYSLQLSIKKAQKIVDACRGQAGDEECLIDWQNDVIFGESAILKIEQKIYKLSGGK